MTYAEMRLGREGQGDQIHWSHAGGRYVRRYVVGNVDDCAVAIQDSGFNPVVEVRLDAPGRRPQLALRGAEVVDLGSKSSWSDASGRLRVTSAQSGPFARIMVEGDERLKVQAADDRVHIWIPGGLRLTRYVRNLQVRTVVDGGLDVQGPLERTVYANPLGRSPDEEERAIVVGAPIYCRHTPALKVARFKLSLRCKAMLVAVVVASRLEETWAGQPLVDASRLLDREMLAVGLGDGLVAAAVLAAIADIRTYCRAILGKLG